MWMIKNKVRHILIRRFEINELSYKILRLHISLNIKPLFKNVKKLIKSNKYFRIINSSSFSFAFYSSYLI
jgi:hypothetical protein